MRVLLAVDLSYQTYRAAHAHKDLRNADGVFTGGLYGFLVTLAKIINDTEATHVVVTEDRKPYRRSTLYPEYKMLRKSTQDDDLKRQVDISKQQILDTLAVIGIPTIGVDGFESDDIIAHLVRQHRHRYSIIYAASNDSDLFQLFTCPWFKVYHKDLSGVMDFWKLRDTTGLDPEEFVLASALMGTHNDVAGIKGVGEKTAYRAVRDPAALRMYRERYASLIERNQRLIRLPYEGFPQHLAVPGPTKRFNARELYRYISRHDITVTQPMLTAFEAVCP